MSLRERLEERYQATDWLALAESNMDPLVEDRYWMRLGARLALEYLREQKVFGRVFLPPPEDEPEGHREWVVELLDLDAALKEVRDAG